MMSNQAFLQALAAILDVPADQLHDDFPLGKVAWNSMALLATIAEIDKHFKIVADGTELGSCNTVGDLLQTIENAKHLNFP